MGFSFLLAMQAAGMVVDYLGTMQQQEFAKMGLKVQQAGIDTNIAQTRLETEDASLQAMKQLRKNMGTQLAVFSARGTSTAGGSSLAIFNESLSNFNADERMRQINQSGREAQLQLGGTVAKLNNAANSSKLWTGFAQRTFSAIGTNPKTWAPLAKSFGLTSLE